MKMEGALNFDTTYEEFVAETQPPQVSDKMEGERRKRKLSDIRGNRKFAKQPLSAKAPLQILNEMFGKVEFDVTFNEEDPGKGFTATFVHDGDTFQGVGPSKKKAKTEAAKQCLIKHNLEFNRHLESDKKNEYVSSEVLGPVSSKPHISGSDTDVDFSEDFANFNDTTFFSCQGFSQRFLPAGELVANFKRLKSMKIDFNLERASEHPSMVLNELFPKITESLVWLETGSSQKFHCKVEIHGNSYYGLGVGKRHAKHELAKSVLSALLGIKYFRQFKSQSFNKGNALPISKKHPFAQVKQIDPNAQYEFTEMKSEAGETLGWEVILKMNEKQFQASDKEKVKAKLQVSKQAFEEYKEEHPEEMVIEKKIDTTKNPIQMLHEYHNNIEYIEESILDEDSQMFLVGLQVDGKTFTATASSKKKAKLQLAINVFKDIHQVDPSEWTLVASEMKDEIEVTKTNMKKNPVSLLSELHPGLEYTVTDHLLEANKAYFEAFIQFGESTFEGKGPTKKSAKADAASKVLDAVYNIKDVNMIEDALPTLNYATDIDNNYSAKIFQAVSSKFSQVFHSDIPHKVLAAIVMAKSENGELTDCFEVISIGTGTKCIGGSSINNAGQVLNDCHAEIIACRGLRQFLFDQLNLAMNNKDSCLEKVGQLCYFEMKSNMHLFLFCNTAPCGDGRVYNSTSVSSKNKTVGVLRTKIENGQGTVPVPTNKVQTTDGILGGERLLTMSCSDKIMKWNVLGLQGSLLSLFLKPIYLKGIIIGDLYNYDHLTRSLFSRMQGLTGSVLPFKSTKPSFGHYSSTDGRDTSKATNNSYNWYYDQNTVEIINAVTGKTLVSTPSRLSKLAFFKKFRDLEKSFGLEMKVNTYHEAKHSAKNYQSNKKLFFNHLEEQGYGKWVGKPIEQDTFS